MGHNLTINLTTQEMIDAMDHLVAILYLDGSIKMVNQAWKAASENRSGNVTLTSIGVNYFDILKNSGELSLLHCLNKVSSGDFSQYKHTYPCHSPDREQYYEMTVTPIRDENKIQGLMIQHIDSSEFVGYKDQLNDIMESMTDGFFAIDSNWKITYVNKEALRLLGMKIDHIIGKSVWHTFPSLLNTKFEDGYHKATSQKKTVRIEEYFEPKKTWFQVHFYPRKHGGLTIYFQSINQRKKMEERLIRSAFIDDLTGLPNQKYLQKEITESIAFTEHLTIFFIDIDGFKNINDLYGHNMGDELIKQFSDRLEDITEEGNHFVARFSGDEFVILYRGKAHNEAYDSFSNLIIQEIQRPFQILQHNEFSITASIGVSQYPHDGVTAEELLSASDTAMYNAKERKGNQVTVYHQQMKENLAYRMLLLNQLKKALETDDLYFVFQPQVSLSSGKITGIEVLSRWNDAHFGHVSPGEFIPLAEESGLIKNLTNKLINQVFPLLKDWLDQGLYKGSLAINFSTSLLEADSFIEDFITILKSYSFPPGTIEIELTESVQLLTSPEISGHLETLRKNGVKIAIDDFGTGYSNFAYLSEFPLDKVKIDMAFIHHIGTNIRVEEILQSLIQLSKKLGYDCIAEGVETKEQLQFLQKKHCDLIQGYYFYPPLGQSKLLTELKKQLPS